VINSGLRYWVVPTFLPLAVARCRPVLVIEWAGAGWNGRAGIYVGIWSSVSDYRHGHSLYPVRRNARRGAAVHPVVGEEQRFDRENAHIAGVGWGGRRRISGLTKLPSRLRAADWSGSSAWQMVGRPPTRTTQTQRGFCVGRATTANSVVPPVTAAVRPRDSVRAHPPAETDATSSAGPVHGIGRPRGPRDQRAETVRAAEPVPTGQLRLRLRLRHFLESVRPFQWNRESAGREGVPAVYLRRRRRRWLADRSRGARLRIAAVFRRVGDIWRYPRVLTSRAASLAALRCATEYHFSGRPAPSVLPTPTTAQISPPCLLPTAITGGPSLGSTCGSWKVGRAHLHCDVLSVLGLCAGFGECSLPSVMGGGQTATGRIGGVLSVPLQSPLHAVRTTAADAPAVAALPQRSAGQGDACPAGR